MWTPDITANATALLAELGPWRNLVGTFRGEDQQSDSGSMVSTVLIAALVVACFSSLAYIAFRHVLERRNRSTAKLFHDLCYAHGLDATDRRLLLQLASTQQLVDPAELFVAPERFDAAKIGADEPDLVARLTALRGLLFRGGEGEWDEASDDDAGDALAEAAARIEAASSWNHPKPTED